MQLQNVREQPPGTLALISAFLGYLQLAKNNMNLACC